MIGTLIGSIFFAKNFILSKYYLLLTFILNNFYELTYLVGLKIILKFSLNLFLLYKDEIDEFN